MKVVKKIIQFSAGFFLIGLLQANLVIQISQGVDRPFPITVNPFQNDVSTASVPQGISGVISSDLSMTGQFSVSSQTQNANSDYDVTGVVQDLGGGRYQVQFKLMSAINHQLLIGQRFQGIERNQLRALAHHISDEIYQYITGVPGIFRTRLAYVEVSDPTSRDAVYRLVVSGIDGFNPQVLLRQVGIPIASPSWSPEGSQLAYVSYLNNKMVVYTINLATGERHLLADYPGMNSAPSYAPNGREMALALSMGSQDQTNLYLLNLDTHQLTQLTHLGTNTSPEFSPNGRSLVFTSDRTGNPQIYKINLDSKAVSRVTTQGVKNFSAMYTPDGQDLVLMYQASSGGAIRIAKLNLNTHVLTVLTHGELDKSPSVAPNGQMVIYANYDGARGILAETSINGKVSVRLPATNGSVQSPAWSPR